MHGTRRRLGSWILVACRFWFIYYVFPSKLCRINKRLGSAAASTPLPRARSTGDLPPGALPLSRRMLDARAHFKIAAAKMVRHQASWAAWRVGSYAGSSLGPMAPHSTRWYTWLTAAKKTQSSMEHGTVHGNLGNGTKAQRRRMPKTRELLEDGQYSVYTRG